MTVASRETVLRHRPSKPLRRPLKQAEVLAQQRRLATLRAREPALFAAGGARPVSGSPVPAEPAHPAIPSGIVRDAVLRSPVPVTQPVLRVAEETEVVELVIRGSWRRAVLSLSILMLAVGSSAFLLGRMAESETVATDADLRPVTGITRQAVAPADIASDESATQGLAHWRSAARQSGARAEALSRELVSVQKEKALLSRSVGILEAETLNLQTELLERELDVVSLNAELEERTEQRVVYNITNLPIDGAQVPGGEVPESAGLPVETSGRYDDVPSGDSYSTAGQASNAGAYGN